MSDPGPELERAPERMTLSHSYQQELADTQLGAGNKFIPPTIVNGKVCVGTTNSVEVFGLLP
jgi:hypothetical protein